MATVTAAPSCVSVRVSGCRIFLKFTLALKRAIVVRPLLCFVCRMSLVSTRLLKVTPLSEISLFFFSFVTVTLVVTKRLPFCSQDECFVSLRDELKLCLCKK